MRHPFRADVPSAREPSLVLSRRVAGLGCLRRMSDDDTTIIGQRIGYSDSLAEVFGVSRADRRRHLYVQGKTGSGKSTLLIAMIAQDLARGEGGLPH